MRKIFEATVRKLRGRMMPPPGDPQPDQKSVDALVSWLEGTLDAAAASRPHPSRVALHRLNRQEYGNAVRDLLALDINATTLLPQDDQLHGFDNIADALQVSPSFIEQYVTAARSVAVQAVGQRDVRPAARPTKLRPGRRTRTSTVCRSARAAASSRSTSFPPTASTRSASPTWRRRFGSTTWSSRTPWW